MARKKKNSNLELVVQFDETTGLPLIQEQEKILDLVKTYLALPYTVAEYGCGNKCNLILNKLVELKIPAYALKRGMIMEKDMSPNTLKQSNFRKRPHALIIDNPLYHPKDLYQEMLFKMVQDKCKDVSIKDGMIQTGSYLLNHDKELQFIEARSHIFATIIFWDDEQNLAHELVIDPTIRQDSMFELEELRDFLNDDEALILTAPMLGIFRLDERYLTFLQEEQLAAIKFSSTEEILYAGDHSAFIRHLNGAEKGSIGDPDQWTYANNIPFRDSATQTRQKLLTGKGDILKNAFERMLQARKSHQGEVLLLRKELQSMVGILEIESTIKKDAKLAEQELAPLAEVELIIAYFRAARQLSRWLQKQLPLHHMFTKQSQLNKVVGISMRLRQRIDNLAEASKDSDEKIDARALNKRYFQATRETIRQMNTAGMNVFIDKVGNIHGIYLPNGKKINDLHNEAALKRLTQNAICHCSHIDTVMDAGKFDGRLGVLAGIETAHILVDLQKYFNYQPTATHLSKPILVSAFIGEEMTFTGEEVSMPGSAAVVGKAAAEQVYKMKNYDGDRFEDSLAEMLHFLKKQQSNKAIQLVNDFETTATDDELLEACFDPTLFFTPHTYERHIEQGPLLDRKNVPLVIVDTIMGIHQEDFSLFGELAEVGALQFNSKLRDLSKDNLFKSLRVTMGVMESDAESAIYKDLDYAVRVQLKGQRNHAGATMLSDRKDAGVAISRLANHFLELIEPLTEQQKLIPVIGEIVLSPGTNRNVIPGKATLTLGIIGDIREDQKQYLTGQLQSWVFGTLSNSVLKGGEGVNLTSLLPIDFITCYQKMRVSIDVRGAKKTTINQFLEEAYRELFAIADKLNLTTSNSIEQQLKPIPLKKSGQVLQIERSYGGSHNPNEALLGNDLLIGSLMQLEVTLQFLNNDQKEGTTLYKLVKERIPKTWSSKLGSFVSGALHDTCNIASKATMSMNGSTTVHAVPAKQTSA